MTHDLMRRKLFDFYDGELTGGEHREVANHLLQCSDCSTVYAQWQRTASALFHAPLPQPSEALVARVLQALPDAGRIPARPPAVVWSLRLRWLVPACGVAVLLSLMLRPMERAVSVDALLLSDNQVSSSGSQVILARDMPSTDEVWHVIMEGAE